MRHNRILRGLLWVAAVSLVPTAIGLAQMQGPPSGGTTGLGQRPDVNSADPTRAHDETRPSQDVGSISQEQMDKEFVHGALQGGMAEVALGKLALEKSSNEDVKKFAQRMVEDHTKLGEAMKPVAHQIGVKIPDNLSKKDQSLQTKLQSLSGSEFDKAYLQAMLKDHKKDYAEFQHAAQSASIAAVKDAAQKGEPVIKFHLDHVQQLAKSMMTSEGMATR